jgi:hypothetical protein
MKLKAWKRIKHQSFWILPIATQVKFAQVTKLKPYLHSHIIWRKQQESNNVHIKDTQCNKEVDIPLFFILLILITSPNEKSIYGIVILSKHPNN